MSDFAEQGEGMRESNAETCIHGLFRERKEVLYESLQRITDDRPIVVIIIDL